MALEFNIALTGLNAASTRIANSAQNTVNRESYTSTINGEVVNTPFVPQEVEQRSLDTGGVATSLRPVEPASIPVFDPQNPAVDGEGFVQAPNVDLEREQVDRIAASAAFKANLKVIESGDLLLGSLLDIKS
jgi:flagellar basal-body rod protein FlgC